MATTKEQPVEEVQEEVQEEIVTAEALADPVEVPHGSSMPGVVAPSDR